MVQRPHTASYGVQDFLVQPATASYCDVARYGSGKHSCVIKYSTYQYILVCARTYAYVLEHTGSYQYILVHSSMYWNVQARLKSFHNRQADCGLDCNEEENGEKGPSQGFC